MENEWQPNPGFCPVEDHTLVEVEVKGKPNYTLVRFAFVIDWTISGFADVVKWRLHSGN